VNAFKPLIRELQLRWFTWALAEISPLHPDVPYIVRRLNDLRRTQ
jgi:hypothetical protein